MAIDDETRDPRPRPSRCRALYAGSEPAAPDGGREGMSPFKDAGRAHDRTRS